MKGAGTPRVCLSMIVRNEAAIIERCLKSAIPLIDAAVICDTGSRDDTACLAEQVGTAHGIPIAILHHEWQDFATNRTLAIRAAQAFAASLGWLPAETYWLFLDADYELVIEPDFDPHSLQAEAIMLRQRCGPLEYWNLRLARADLDWRLVGPTHEHYACDQIVRNERLTSLWIRDHDDGGSKASKFDRDIALLSEHLERHPGDPRTLFYLAQSYAAIGDTIKALVLYSQRIAAGGWLEEVWYSKLAMGRLYALTGDVDSAEAVLLDAQATDPDRAEPLYELARALRLSGRAAEAAACADRGLSVAYPSHRNLFIHTDVYEYGLDRELALAAPDTPFHERGFASCDRLAHSRTAPPEVVADARQLLLSYARSLKGMGFLPLQPGIPPSFAPCNPSILRTADGYLVNCRAVNYEQRRLRYQTRDVDGIYRTRNVLMRLDHSFSVVDEREMTIAAPPVRETMVRGLEDCRLFDMKDVCYVFCTTTDRHPSGHVHQSICELDPDGHVIRHQPLVGPFDDRPQKNWLPYSGPDGSVFAFYAYDPITIVRVSAESGRYDVERQVPHALKANHWRGSAGPVQWPRDGDRWLLLLHEAVDRRGRDEQWERVYLHRFVELDSEFSPARVSRPFVFAHHGVEFSCGMALSHDQSNLIVGVGVEDARAYLCRVPVVEIVNFLDTGIRVQAIDA